MTMPPADDNQPTYVDPVTGQPLYINPATGELAYTDPTGVAPTVAYPAAGYAPSGYPPSGVPQVNYPGSPADPSVPQTDYTAPTYSPSAYAQPGYGYPGYPAYPVGGVPLQGRTNPLAITSMILSICALPFLFCYGVGGLLGLAGAIVGHVAKRRIAASGEGGDGMAMAGIIIGWIALALGIVVAIIVGFVVADVIHSGDGIPAPVPS